MVGRAVKSALTFSSCFICFRLWYFRVECYVVGTLHFSFGVTTRQVLWLRRQEYSFCDQLGRHDIGWLSYREQSLIPDMTYTFIRYWLGDIRGCLCGGRLCNVPDRDVEIPYFLGTLKLSVCVLEQNTRHHSHNHWYLDPSSDCTYHYLEA